MNDLLNYDTSWLNPVLKLAIAALFLFVAYVFYRTRPIYRGDLLRVLNVLFGFSVVAVIAYILRYFGDGVDFGFTKEFSLKWFQSLGFVLQAILFAIAAWWMAKGIVPDLRD
jgi:putative exporter of polyketide antibiotics